MNFAKANQNLNNLGNMSHNQIGGTFVGIDVVGVDFSDIFDGNRVAQKVVHQIIKTILTGNRYNATLFHQVFSFFEPVKFGPYDDGNSKTAGSMVLCRPVAKAPPTKAMLA